MVGRYGFKVTVSLSIASHKINLEELVTVNQNRLEESRSYGKLAVALEPCPTLKGNLH